jgi:transaldolase/transaldolase/glucose-6-phosphate isomerase
MAYIRGLEKNSKPQQVASVASFFVSRIDTAVDKALEKTNQTAALKLRGTAAVAYSKMIYRLFREIFYGELFEKQRNRGSRVQKIVWGSTGTKNPAYSDVLYVDELIGSDTINTIPMATLKAFLDHGNVRSTLGSGIEEAKQNLADLKKFNIDINKVTDQLLTEGVQAFVQSYDQMLESLKERIQQNRK